MYSNDTVSFEADERKAKKDLLEDIEEARRISRDPDAKEYTSMEELKAALND